MKTMDHPPLPPCASPLLAPAPSSLRAPPAREPHHTITKRHPEGGGEEARRVMISLRRAIFATGI
jgi:hypothetical protein